jgi:Na+-translocating ferredoxin:NAD+ oxidoreductase subunit B
MNDYETLQQLLDASPTGAPAAESFDEILRILFTPEEAALAVHLTLFPRPLQAIASAAGMTEDAAGKILEAMAEKAVIISKEKNGMRSYALLPTIPGLFEFPLMKGSGTPMHDRLSTLWNEYHRQALGAAFSGNPTPIARVIPVGKSVETVTRIHPYEEVARLLQAVDFIALAPCACRQSIKACDKPVEMCFIFDGHGRFLVQRGFARQIDREEAIRVLDKAEEAGLVHTSNNSADKPGFICNCCSCCCTILTCKTQLNLPNAFATSSFEARVSTEDCTGCGICTDDRCPVEAISIPGDTAQVDAGKCIGCGLCVSVCPTGSISLIGRDAPPEIMPTMQEMGMKILTEKGRLEKFMSQMK